jgi:hypothetical protein
MWRKGAFRRRQKRRIDALECGFVSLRRPSPRSVASLSTSVGAAGIASPPASLFRSPWGPVVEPPCLLLAVILVPGQASCACLTFCKSASPDLATHPRLYHLLLIEPLSARQQSRSVIQPVYSFDVILALHLDCLLLLTLYHLTTARIARGHRGSPIPSNQLRNGASATRTSPRPTVNIHRGWTGR